MNREWLAEIELSTEVARIIAPSDVLPCVLKETTIEAHYCPTVGMNIISKVLAEKLTPNASGIDTGHVRYWVPELILFVHLSNHCVVGLWLLVLLSYCYSLCGSLVRGLFL